MTLRLWLLCCITIYTFRSVDSVKIGVSKHVVTSTTSMPSITSTSSQEQVDEETLESVTEPYSTTLVSSTTPEIPHTSSTLKPTKRTTTTTLPPDEEWPEFPPRKKPTTPKSTTISTKKPMTTSKTKWKTSTTTTEMPQTTNISMSSTEFLNTSKAIRGHPNKYCFCDITSYGCDINCCCDPDCSNEALNVFKCLKEISNDYELHEGRFEDFKFQHGLPSCEVNDGWLCVFRTNIPAKEKKIHPNFFDNSRYYQWPNLLKDDIETINTRELYVYGNPLKLINMETNEMRNFDLPSSLKPPYCQTKEPIKYLKSQRRTCLIAKNKQIKEMQNYLKELKASHKLLQKPTISNEIFHSKELNNYLVNITLHWCNTTTEKCQKFIKSKEHLNGSIFNKIQINIFHNFTNIQGADIAIWYDKKENNEETNAEFWLQYDINFWNKTLEVLKDNVTNTYKEYHKISSGPLGYIIGRPIIFSKYVKVNKSLPLTEKNRQLNYFNDDDDENNNEDLNTLPVFKKQQGLCKHPPPRNTNGAMAMETINYGINLAKQCKLKMENVSINPKDPMKTNYTAICLQLQDAIHHQFFGFHFKSEDISLYYVSQLGRPQNDSNKWINLNVYNGDFDPVYGQYLENTGNFICRNILLSLSYEFRMRNMDVYTRNGDLGQNQNVLKYANLIMGERHDLEFSSDEDIEVPLTLTIRFYDINEKAASASSCLCSSILMIIISFILAVHI
ncbi:tectonic-like isoform X1 [Haematobia irritans]|uniref:tectonic-like isoform X1 n=1 Tax=Haematobia irritans TaxID=7368 RepID=UPI003F4FC7FE